MFKKGILLQFNLLLMFFLLLVGCSNSTAPSYNGLQLDMPPSIEAQLITIPNEPTAGESTLVRVILLDEVKPRDGMRIELRNNERDTRLYEAKEKIEDNQLIYEIQAVFEQRGENLITYHFNVDNYHVMSSFSIEVK